MNCLRPTQIITNWLNEVCQSENDTRLNMYYQEIYQQQLTQKQKQKQKQKKVIVEMVQLPKEHVLYQPTLLPTPPNTPSPPQLDDKAMLKDTPHSAKAPHVGKLDVFLLGP